MLAMLEIYAIYISRCVIYILSAAAAPITGQEIAVSNASRGSKFGEFSQDFRRLPRLA
jgi:hypothetical protein